MTLDDWIDANGRGKGAIQRLHERAGVSLPVIARACEGRASLASATKLHEAVGRVVPISSMTGDEVPAALERPAPKARKSTRASATRRKRRVA
jgi:hypothetical protein